MTRTSLFATFIFLSLCVLIPHGNTQTHAIDGEYITEWLVLGPFFSEDLENRTFHPSVGGDADTQPQEGDTVATADGQTLTWKRCRSQTDLINLLNAVGNSENATAYAFCVLESEIPIIAEIRLGSDDGVAVWINGKRVHHNPVTRGMTLDEDVFEVDLKAGANHCLVKVSQEIDDWGFAMRVFPADRASISGTITDEASVPIPNASVRLEQEGSEIVRTTTDESGSYWLGASHGTYDLSATQDERGDWQLGLRLRQGEDKTLNLRLEEAISISGRLLMLDGKGLHAAVPVQAVIPGRGDSPHRPITTTLSDEDGKYRLINLKPGRYQVRCQVPGGYIYYDSDTFVSSSSSAPSHGEGEILQADRSKTLAEIDFRFAPFKKGVWRNYNALDGLVHNWVSAIHRSPDGMMWFGTAGGISRYDGKGFVNFTTKDGLAHNTIWAIHQASDGTLWFGTEGGVSRYDGHKFLNFTIEDGLANNRVTAVHQAPDGVMWFGTEGGVSRYDGKNFISLTTRDELVHNRVRAIYGMPDGVMWFATWGGVSRYDGQMFTNFTTMDGLADNRIYTLSGGEDSVIWFGTWGGGVSRYDGAHRADGEKFVNLTTENGLASNFITAAFRDSAGMMWFATREGGVSRYDGQTFVNFTTKDELANNQVSVVYGAPDGVMWFGTRNGVSRYDGVAVINLTPQDGLPHNRVWSIGQEADGPMWFATLGNGVFRYDEADSANSTALANLTTKDGLVNDTVYAAYSEPNGEMWFGTLGGVSRYNGQEFVNVTVKDGLGSNTVWAVHGRPNGEIWFGTSGGGSRYDGEKFVNFTTTDGLADNRVTTVHQGPAGAMWFGTRTGVSRYDGEKFVNFNTNNGLADNYVHNIYRSPSGVMWFGTSSGISRYDGKKFVTLGPEGESTSNGVWAIHHDIDGIVWLGRYGGSASLSGYDGTAWTSLDVRDGLIGNEVHSIHQDTTGLLWLGTDKGVTRYRRSTTPPGARIDSVRAEELYLADLYSGRFLQPIPPITAGAHVTINYRAIDFKTVLAKRQYRTRVLDAKGRDGVAPDQAWEAPTKSTSFEWRPKKAGTYTFGVQAIDRDLNYSQPASVTLKVVPPWYLNGWIIVPGGGTMLAILISAIFFGTRYYIERHRTQQAELKAQRLRDQMLEQERQARDVIENSYTELQGAHETLQQTKLEVDHRLEETVEELQETQQQVAQQERLRALGQMASGIAHDFNNLLQPVLGFSDMCLNSPEILDNREQAIRFLEMIYIAAKDAAGVVQRLREFYRQREPGETFQPVNLNQLVEQVIPLTQPKWKDQAQANGITIQVETDLQEVPLIMGKGTELREVLTNLIFNAVDAIVEDGTITLRTYFDGEHVVLGVVDTGMGMTAETQERCFEPFFSTKEERGTGLGLSMVFGIIQRHEGEITVESTPGKGTTFSVCLPPLENGETEDIIQEVEAPPGSLRVLVVDDEPMVCEMISTYLTTDGHTVEVATNGREGLERFHAGQFDLVITDKAMPEINGDELAATVKQIAPDTPVIMLTGFGDIMEISGEQPAGVDAILGKPATLQMFRETLAAVTSSSS